MYSTQKNGAFAVVEARNAPCPMEWGCPKDRSMTVINYVRNYYKRFETNKPSAKNTKTNDAIWVRTSPGGPVYACIFRAWFVCTHLNLVIF